MKIPSLQYILCILALVFSVACNKSSSIEDNSIPPPPDPEIDEAYELSYWIDIDVRQNNGRGYWFNATALAENVVPTEAEIENSCKGIAQVYYGSKLYVTYHRQFEIDKAKQVFLYWKKYGGQNGIDIVPTLVLENYAAPTNLNFTDEELIDLATWCTTNINPDELGIYDVYVRQSVGSAQDQQLTELSGNVQVSLIRVGVQPGEQMNSYFSGGVQDTWSAECQGLTNELWEDARYYKGTNKYGRRLLQEWVNERLNGEKRKIIWDLIPVAWDYDDPTDPFGYISPGDNALTNDPPVDGRLQLTKKYILSWYPAGTSNRLFGGFSCDLHILDANSSGKPESPTFYEQLRNGQSYQGHFANAINEVAEIYKGLNP